MISPQELGEFFTTITHEWSRKLSVADTATDVERLRGYDLQAITGASVSATIDHMQSLMLSYWDALIRALTQRIYFSSDKRLNDVC